MASCQRGQRGRGRSRMRSDDGWSGWGGYMNAKIEKLDKQGLPLKVSDIFKGVAIFVNGYTKPPQDELKRLILENGGVYIHYYSRSKVTHIIASNLPTSKIARLRDEKVVRPDWITASVNSGRLLPFKDYLLYDQKGSGNKTSLLTSLRKSIGSTSSSANGFHDLASSNGNSTSVNTSVATALEDDLFPWSEVENAELTTADDRMRDMEMEIDPDPEMTVSDVDKERLSTSTADTTTDSDCFTANVVEDSGCLTENIPRNFDRSSEKLRVADGTASSSAVAKAGDPGFVSEFYNHSRLHHLSTWGAEFKAYVTSLQGQANYVYSGREKLRHIVASRDNSERSILEETGRVARLRVMMHIDMDCFFVSVALRNRPELKGRPVAVTHSKGKGSARNDSNEAAYATEAALWNQRSTGNRPIAPMSDNKPAEQSINLNGVHNSRPPMMQPSNKDTFYSMAEVASCSYEARKAGVKNGMLFGKAKQLCPDLIPVPYDFEGYREVSQQLYDTVGSYTLEIEAVSCDELYVDCSDVVADTGASPLEFSSLLRQEIFEKTGCTASAGLGGNMLLARLATKVAKPDGQFLVEPDNISDFIKDVLVSDLPGVGRVMSNKLETLNIRTCQQLQSLSLPLLQKHFGQKTGQMLFRCARGEDDRMLKTAIERKSVSAEINYGIRFTMMNEAEKFLGELSAEVQSRLRNINRKGKTITLKLKVRHQDAPKVTAKFMGHGVCDSLCKSSTLPMATDNADIIAQECCSLLRQIKVDPEDLRGMGIQMTFLEAPPIGHSSSSGCHSILDFAAPAVKDPRTPDPRQVSTMAGKTAAAESTSVSVASVNHRPVCKNFASVADMMRGHSKVLSAGVVNRPISTNTVNSSHCIIKKSSDAYSLPPLPNLGDVNSGVLETEEVASAAQASHDNYPYLPSQIDESVLDELPEDIQTEIREALKKKRQKLSHEFGRAAETERQKMDPESKAVTVVDEEKPGCSHWRDDAKNHVAEAVYDPMDLPPYSQLDASFLNALPEDLRDEIESAYAKEQMCKAEVDRCASPPQKALHPLMRANIRNSSKPPPNKTSPVKRISPKKSPAKRTSPSFKVPTGKPPGKRKHLAKKRIQFPVKPPVQCSTPTTRRASVQGAKTEQMTIDSHLSRGASTLREIEVSVAGCVTLDQVKGLLRTWMDESTVPDDEDLNTFFQYLTQLIEAKNLERVNILLKFIHRLRQDRNLSSAWEVGCQWLIDQTQLVVQSLYGGPIKLPTY